MNAGRGAVLCSQRVVTIFTAEGTLNVELRMRRRNPSSARWSLACVVELACIGHAADHRRRTSRTSRIDTAGMGLTPLLESQRGDLAPLRSHVPRFILSTGWPASIGISCFPSESVAVLPRIPQVAKTLRKNLGHYKDE
jgi:hypothetical protein